jgi:hypothetical protein
MVKPFPTSFPSNPTPLQEYSEPNSTVFQYTGSGWFRKIVRLSDEFPIKDITDEWTPAEITTALWLDAADSSTITLNGSNVSQWNDKSGNTRNVLQAVAGDQPTYTEQINSKSVITFNNDILRSSGNVNLGLINRSAFIVAQATTAVDCAGLLSLEPASGNDWEQLTATAYETGSAPNIFQVAGSTFAAYNPQIAGTRPSPLGIYSEVKAAGTGTVYLNGSSIATDSTFTEFEATNTGRLLIGGRYFDGAVSANSRLIGRLAEIIYIESALSLADRQLVEGYLAHKWGLTANLPGDHPYKTIKP